MKVREVLGDIRLNEYAYNSIFNNDNSRFNYSNNNIF